MSYTETEIENAKMALAVRIERMKKRGAKSVTVKTEPYETGGGYLRAVLLKDGKPMRVYWAGGVWKGDLH